MANRARFPVCIFCKTSQKDDLNLGEFMRTKQVYAHYFCVLLSSNLQQRGRDDQGILGFLAQDIAAKARYTARFRCCYCKNLGANIQCDKCQARFHLPCGISKGCVSVFADRFETYCHKHRSHNIPRHIQQHISRYNCVICYETFQRGTSAFELLFGSCCNRHIFHKRCLRQYAASAGYFTHCPICKSKDLFLPVLQQFGVFVPERDAAWELEEHAYADLEMVDPLFCSGEPCHCPLGPKYNNNRRKWKIHRCNNCGKNGIHAHCSAKKGDHICPTCDVSKVPKISEEERHSSTPCPFPVAGPSSKVHVIKEDIDEKPASVVNQIKKERVEENIPLAQGETPRQLRRSARVAAREGVKLIKKEKEVIGEEPSPAVDSSIVIKEEEPFPVVDLDVKKIKVEKENLAPRSRQRRRPRRVSKKRRKNKTQPPVLVNHRNEVPPNASNYSGFIVYPMIRALVIGDEVDESNFTMFREKINDSQSLLLPGDFKRVKVCDDGHLSPISDPSGEETAFGRRGIRIAEVLEGVNINPVVLVERLQRTPAGNFVVDGRTVSVRSRPLGNFNHEDLGIVERGGDHEPLIERPAEEIVNLPLAHEDQNGPQDVIMELSPSPGPSAPAGPNFLPVAEAASRPSLALARQAGTAASGPMPSPLDDLIEFIDLTTTEQMPSSLQQIIACIDLTVDDNLNVDLTLSDDDEDTI